MDSPWWWLVGGPNVGYLLLGELSVSPVFAVILLEGFGDDCGVPSSVDARNDVSYFLVIVLAILNHLEVSHDVCMCRPQSL